MKLYTTFFLFLSGILLAQTKEQYELMGALKLNGSDTQLISYKIVFTEAKGLIKGYSITDLGGDHETKNTITGSYNAKNNLFEFREESIVYTKSKIKKDMFCYVNFSGKMNLKSKAPKINDKFTGLYQNKTKCVDGVIQMIGSKRIYDLVKKVTAKIQKSKKVNPDIKEKVNPLKLLDSINSNVLRSKQHLQVYTKDDKIYFEVYDAGVEDGDMINIYVNHKVVLEHYIVKTNPKVLEVPVDTDSVWIEIEALNEGEAPPNTSDIIIRDSTNELKTISKLEKNAKTTIEIIKQ